VYKVQSTGALVKAQRAAAGGRIADRVGKTVLLLGACSLLTDISSEMVAAVLPVYLVSTLGFSPLAYGLVDGIYQGASALVRLAGGFVGDRMRRHKPVAAIGYGVSAVCKLGLAVVGTGVFAISSIVLADRAGKGLRTAPRDAMISLTAQRRDLGLAFGVHRAMDTAGAMLGPVVAFLLLASAPGAFHSLFLLSFFIAALGLGVLVLLVREPRAKVEEDEERPQLRAAFGLVKERRFRRLGLASCALGLATASDGFVYLLLLKDHEFDLAYFPLLATGAALSYMVLAVPAGRLADRYGRVRVMLAGYALLAGVYALLLAPGLGSIAFVGVLALLGAYYAATDGVLMALGSAEVPEALRGSGLALLGTASSTARLVSSLAFGALWTATSADTAVMVFGIALLLAMGLAARGLRGADVH
jgi:MFS family permease